MFTKMQKYVILQCCTRVSHPWGVRILRSYDMYVVYVPTTECQLPYIILQNCDAEILCAFFAMVICFCKLKPVVDWLAFFISVDTTTIVLFYTKLNLSRQISPQRSVYIGPILFVIPSLKEIMSSPKGGSFSVGMLKGEDRVPFVG